MLRQIKDLKAPLLDKNGQDDNVGTIVWIEESNNDPSKTQKKRKKDVFDSRFFKTVACCLLFVLFNLAIFTKQEQQVKPLRKRLPKVMIATDSQEDGQLPIGDKDDSSKYQDFDDDLNTNAEIDYDYEFHYDDFYDVHDDVFGGYDDLTTVYNDMVDDGSEDSMLKSEQNSAFQENSQKEDEIYKIDRSIAVKPDELEEGFGLLGSKGTFKQNEEREKKKELDFLNRTQDEVNGRDNLMEVKDASGNVYYMDMKTNKIIFGGDSSIEEVETPTNYDFVNTPRCGATWEDANNHCYGSCQSDNDCYQERKCFFDLANDCPSVVDLPMSGRLSFIEDIGKVKSHWNMPLDKWNFCCGEGHYCSTCYGQSCCTGEPKCCQFGDDYDAECCSKAPGRCYWNECKPCPAGTYSPVGGHYAHVPGYTCPPCPPGTTSEEGATECYPDVRTEVLSDGGEEDYEPSGGNGEDDGVGALEDEVSATEPSDGGEEDYELEFLGGESATTDLDIHQAASAGDLNRIKEIVKYQGRSQVYKADHHGWRPLHEAARSGHADVVEYLLKEGAKKNERTNLHEGGNALYWAQKDPKKNARAIAVLKKYGAFSVAPFEYSNLVSDTGVSRHFLMELKDDSGKSYYMDGKTKQIILDLRNYIDGVKEGGKFFVTVLPHHALPIGDKDYSSKYQGNDSLLNGSEDSKDDKRQSVKSNSEDKDFKDWNDRMPKMDLELPGGRGVTGITEKTDEEKTDKQNSNLVSDAAVSRDNLTEVKDDSGKVYYIYKKGVCIYDTIYMKLSDVSGKIYYANMGTKQIVPDKERDRKNELERLSVLEDNFVLLYLKDDSGKSYYMDTETEQIISSSDVPKYLNGLKERGSKNLQPQAN